MLKSKLLILILISNLFFLTKVKANKTDSLLTLVETTNKLDDKIRLYFEIISDVGDSNPDLYYEYATKAYDIATISNGELWAIKSIYHQAKGKIYQKEIDEAILLINDALIRLDNLSENPNINILTTKASLLEILGWAKVYNEEHYEAIHIYNQALELKNTIGKQDGFLPASIGIICQGIGDYSLAVEYFKESVRLYSEQNNYNDLVIVLINLGYCYHEKKLYTKALEQFDHTLRLAEQYGITDHQYDISFYSARTHFDLKNYDLALKYFLSSKDYIANTDLKLKMAHCQTYISKIKFLTSKDISVLPDLVESYDESLKYADNNSDAKKVKLLSAEALSGIYSSIGNYKKAFEFNKIYHGTKDSISNTDKLLKIRSLDLKNKFEGQQRKAEVTKKEELLETKLGYQFKLIAALALFLLSLLFVSLRLFKSNKANTKMKDKLIIKNNSLKRTEQLLLESNRDMKEYITVNKELEQFASIASHDIKAPLRTIHSFSSLIKKKFYDQAQSKERQWFDFVEKGAKNLNLLVNDLLSYSKSNTKELNIELIDLSLIIEEVILLLNYSISEANAKINIHNCNFKLYADQIKLKQILQNIISNAIKFRDPERQPIISIYGKETDKHYCISIEDNGIGIEEDYFDQVFEKFARLNSKDKYEGTGLGLAICAKYIKEHKGQISIQRNPEYGVTFNFSVGKECEVLKPSLATV